MNFELTPEYIQYLKCFESSLLEVTFLSEGSLLYPEVPAFTIKGPLGYISLFESAFLSMFNYCSLLAVNALLYV